MDVMDSVLTLLTSNLLSRLLSGSLVFFLGCSSAPEKSADEASIELSSELDSLSKKVQVTNFGPTLPDGGVFRDKTKEYGLEGLSAVSFNAVDFNFDGFTDLVIVPTYYSRPKFYVYQPKTKNFKLWEHDPLPLDFKTSFILMYDINKDRVIDLIAGVLNQRSEVSQIPLKIYLGQMKNGKLNFVEDPNAIKLPAEPTSSLSLVDYDLDGWVDLFVGNWFENKNGKYFPVADRLLKNNKGKFEEVTDLLRGEADKNPDQIYPPNAKPTYGSSTCDIDQNGYPDILTASSSGHKNKLWMNRSDQRSRDRHFDDFGAVTNYGSDPNGSLLPTGGGRNFFSACTDYNDDGLMDVFVGSLSHAYDNESVDKSSILTGSKETFPPYFIRTEYVSDATSESWNQGDRRGVWLDYNIDGRIDLVVDNSGFPPYSRLVLFEQDESHAFQNVSSQLGMDIVNPTGTISIDINQDGLPDLITSQNSIRRADIPPRLYVFENNTPRGKRKAMKVHLHGIKSNTEALGAMVMLYTQSQTERIVQRRFVEYSQGGLSSQNEGGVHFGINEGFEAVGIKVKWPYVKQSGFNSGTTIEKLYSFKNISLKDYSEVTVCEDGKILSGKTSCQF